MSDRFPQGFHSLVPTQEITDGLRRILRFSENVSRIGQHDPRIKTSIGNDRMIGDKFVLEYLL